MDAADCAAADADDDDLVDGQGYTTLERPSPDGDSSLPLPGSTVQAMYSRRWQPARVVGVRNAAARELEVTFFGYSDVVVLPPSRWAARDTGRRASCCNL